MSRKNLNDVIHGDRAAVRDNKYGGNGGSALEDWDKWDAKKKDTSYVSKHVETSNYKACYHTHPALKLPGTDLVVYGGSCSSPVAPDADVYIGFDSSMTFTGRQWPWKQGDEFLFKITDMSVPTKPDEFKKMVAWAKGEIDAGCKLHAGCIGGHGRTGMFLSALVSLYGEADAIAYVRTNYCKRAVESSEQVKFLGKHFGVKPASGSKDSGSSVGMPKGSTGSGSSRTESFTWVKGNGAIWS